VAAWELMKSKSNSYSSQTLADVGTFSASTEFKNPESPKHLGEK